MYSKKIQGYDLEYLQSWKDNIRRHHISALPVSHTKGMKDFVMAFAGCHGPYADTHNRILEDSIHKDDGYLEPKCGCIMSDGYIITEYDIDIYRAMMESYDKYLCTDGVIRYRPTPEADAKYATIYKQYEQDSWDSMNETFESMGMHYNETEGCWINPKTGEVGCY